MHGFEVNWLAVLAAAAARSLLGGFWYAPFAFGPSWRRLLGIAPGAARARLGLAMAVDFLAAFVLAWVLANLLQFLGVARAVSGARTAFFLWLGLVAMPLLSITVHERRPWGWFAITAGFWLVALPAMGALIGAL